MKFLLLASVAAAGLTPILATPAYAQLGPEINQDIGCDDATKWMPGTAWAVTGSKCTVTAGRRMNMLMQMTPKVKKNDDLKVTFTVSNFAAGADGGKLVAFTGVKMPTSPTGSYVTVASIAAVPDNFSPVELGLSADPTTSGVYTHNGPGNEADRNGSMRLSCISAGIQRVDPLVYPGTISPHPHDILGASNMEPNWTYNDFRTKAQSSCTNKLDPLHTVNKSGYWFPPLVDGKGDYRKTDPIIIYYKGPAAVALPASVAITASISGGTMTVTSAPTDSVEPGEYFTGAGVTAHSRITAYISGTGAAGTYAITPAQTVGSETITLISPYGDLDPVEAAANPVGTMCANQSYAGVCSNVPRGLRFTGGYKGSFNAITSTDNNCGPADAIAIGGGAGTERCSIKGISSQWLCQGGPNGEGAAAGVVYTSTYDTLQELKNAGTCVTGSKVLRAINYPDCWDGVNADTPNHRDNMAWVVGGKCTAAHPVKIPHISLLVHYTVWSTFNTDAHLASDVMAACYDIGGLAGCTDHWDYWEAWSDAVRDMWYTNCNLPHNSCTNNLGNGYSLKANWTNINGQGGGIIFQNPKQPNDVVRPETLGQSRYITGNGTYTVYLRAVDSGVWGFAAMKGVNAQIDNISIKNVGRR